MEVGRDRGPSAEKNGPEVEAIDGPKEGEKRESPAEVAASAGDGFVPGEPQGTVHRWPRG